jgi:hypothetical protein
MVCARRFARQLLSCAHARGAEHIGSANRGKGACIHVNAADKCSLNMLWVGMAQRLISSPDLLLATDSDDPDMEIADDLITEGTPLRPEKTDNPPDKSRPRLSVVKGILSNSKLKSELSISASSPGDIEMRRLVWADEAKEGKKPLEQVLVIPARPLRRRVASAAGSPSVCMVLMIVAFLVAYWLWRLLQLARS